MLSQSPGSEHQLGDALDHHSDVWKNTGFAMLVFLAGLQNISPEYYGGPARWR
jgi:ABC-type polysaccharide transport system permease subunit